MLVHDASVSPSTRESLGIGTSVKTSESLLYNLGQQFEAPAIQGPDWAPVRGPTKLLKAPIGQRLEAPVIQDPNWVAVRGPCNSGQQLEVPAIQGPNWAAAPAIQGHI